MYGSWTTNHYDSEPLDTAFGLNLEAPIIIDDDMTEEDQLRWWTNFKVILIFNCNLYKSTKMERHYSTPMFSYFFYKHLGPLGLLAN